MKSKNFASICTGTSNASVRRARKRPVVKSQGTACAGFFTLAVDVLPFFAERPLDQALSYMTGTAWAGADDGLLVLDRDGNGLIDTGRELFGNNTLLINGQKAADGYAALRELDANADGVLNAADAQFAGLRVWRDLDQDGVSDAGELFSLDEVGVSQIGLTKTAFSQTLADGTRLDGKGSFVINGQTRTYTDAWFAENPFYREFSTPIEVAACRA